MSNKNDENSPRMPGRPRKFDEAAVLAQATQAFWYEGFEALSYEKLGRDLGLSKPSLYNSFGDKTALFERVLSEYGTMATGAVVGSLQGHKKIADAATAMLTAAAGFYMHPSGHSIGCMMIGTSLPASAQNEKVQHILAGFITGLDKAVAEVLAKDYAADLKRRKTTAEDMARLLTSLLFSLAVRARMGLAAKALRQEAGRLAHSAF